MLMTGAIWVASFLISYVGAGSSVHCLAGTLRSSWQIYSAVTGVNAVSRDPVERASITGGGARSVAARIRFTFCLKCAAKSSAEMLFAVADVGGVNNALIFLHMALESPSHDAIASDQYDSAFLCCSFLKQRNCWRQSDRRSGVGRWRYLRSKYRVFAFSARHSTS